MVLMLKEKQFGMIQMLRTNPVIAVVYVFRHIFNESELIFERQFIIDFFQSTTGGFLLGNPVPEVADIAQMFMRPRSGPQFTIAADDIIDRIISLQNFLQNLNPAGNVQTCKSGLRIGRQVLRMK